MSVLSEMFSRASWGARYRAGFGDRSANYPLPYCWTHHSVTAHLSPNASVAEEKAQMRILENIGQQRFGGGISYSFVIFPSGRIYMGTGASRRGAHTGGFNTLGLGVVFAGNYENHRPTAAAERTYAGLLQELAAIGVLQRARTNGGHRDAPGHSWNACPGRHLHSRLSNINALAAGSSVIVSPPIRGEVMTTPKKVWNYREHDLVNEKSNNSYGFMLARIHQYVHGLRNVDSAILNSRRHDYVNEKPSTLSARIGRAHQYALQASRRSREANEKIDAVADAVAELVGQIDQNTRKALEDRLSDIRTEAARADAAEVAAELEISVRTQEEEDD